MLHSPTSLSQYADVVYGPPSEQAHGEEELEGAVDVADALEEELAVLKQTTSSKGSHHRFKSVSSGARGVLFIKCSPAIEPHGVVNSMFNDVLQQHKRKARYARLYTFNFAVRYMNVCMGCMHEDSSSALSYGIWMLFLVVHELAN